MGSNKKRKLRRKAAQKRKRERARESQAEALGEPKKPKQKAMTKKAARADYSDLFDDVLETPGTTQAPPEEAGVPSTNGSAGSRGSNGTSDSGGSTGPTPGAIVPSTPGEEPTLQTRGAAPASPVPALLAIGLTSAALVGALVATPSVCEWLSTQYAHGFGRLPWLISAALLFLPTPLASVSAGRSSRRVAIEVVAISLGVTLTGFLLVGADLHDRDDWGFVFLLILLLSAAVIRLSIGPRVYRRWLRKELARDPRAARPLALIQAFVNGSPRLFLPALFAAPRVPHLALPVRLQEFLGVAHRGLHGGPSLPSPILLDETRASLLGHLDALRRSIRERYPARLSEHTRSTGAALAAYLESHAMARRLDRRTWPTNDEQLPILADDILLADFEIAYLHLLQAASHPAADEEIRLTRECALESLAALLECLDVRREAVHGALGYLLFAVSLGSGDTDGAAIVGAVNTFESWLAEEDAEPSFAEDFATALVADRLWELGFLHWGLELLDGIEFAERELPMARYVRSRLHVSLQNAGAETTPADRLQLRALASDDAVWADAPELYWKEENA